MSEVLQSFDAEMPGILAWAVAGSQLWLSHGLKLPDAVKQATSEYRMSRTWYSNSWKSAARCTHVQR